MLHQPIVHWMLALALTLSTSLSPNGNDVAGALDEPTVIDLWPETPPGESQSLPPEADTTQPDGDLIAGRRVIRLGNVSTPQIAVYQPPADLANGAAVVICPGGGHYILAYDLEGTEVAQWLNSIGVTAIVLKYRVPSRQPKDSDRRWIAAVQDAQRAVSLVRSKSEDWKIDPDRIGICGFSAGGETAALTSIFLEDRQYAAVDETDSVSCRPDFSMLIYPAGMVAKGTSKLREHVRVSSNVPPMFFVHTFDDECSVQNSLSLATALKAADVSAELHLYARGGHGYGLRKTDQPVTNWPQQAERWLQAMGVVPASGHPDDRQETK